MFLGVVGSDVTPKGDKEAKITLAGTLGVQKSHPAHHSETGFAEYLNLAPGVVGEDIQSASTEQLQELSLSRANQPETENAYAPRKQSVPDGEVKNVLGEQNGPHIVVPQARRQRVDSFLLETPRVAHSGRHLETARFFGAQKNPVSSTVAAAALSQSVTNANHYKSGQSPAAVRDKLTAPRSGGGQESIEMIPKPISNAGSMVVAIDAGVLSDSARHQVPSRTMAFQEPIKSIPVSALLKSSGSPLETERAHKTAISITSNQPPRTLTEMPGQSSPQPPAGTSLDVAVRPAEAKPDNFALPIRSESRRGQPRDAPIKLLRTATIKCRKSRRTRTPECFGSRQRHAARKPTYSAGCGASTNASQRCSAHWR